MQLIKQSEATAARKRIFFTAVSSTNVQTRLTGLTSGSFTVRITKAGAADAAGGGSVTEQDATDMPGIYYYEPSAGDLDTLGTLVLRISYANMEPREIAVQVVTQDPLDAATSAATAILAATIHTGYSVARALRIIAGAVAGKLTGVSTNAPVARFLDDSGNAVTLATNADGRTAASHGA